MNLKSLHNLDLFLKLVLACTGILAIANVVVSNQLSTQGQELAVLTDQITQTQKNNEYLQEQIAASSAISRIESLANAQGYVAISQPLTLTTPVPVAYAPHLQ